MTEYLIIVLVTAVTLVIAVLAFRDLAEGTFQRRWLASRGSVDAASMHASQGTMDKIDAAVRRTEVGKRIERRLSRSGAQIPVGLFVILMAVASVVAVVFIWRLLAPLFGVLSVLAVGFAFFAYLRRQEERRREQFTAQLPEIARVLSNATQAGLALPTAIDMAADELDDPAGTELRLAARSMQVGQPFDEAIADLRDRMPSREIGVLISTLAVASRSGGALVSALRNISDTLETRKETRREVGTILGEATATSSALLFMGVGSLFLLNMMMPGSVRTLTESAPGLAILGIGLGLFVIGYVVIRRITKFDY